MVFSNLHNEREEQLNEPSLRMSEPGKAPGDAETAAWIGKKANGFWKKLTQYIERTYPGVFVPEWLFGGKKYGWALRYKKSKSFCTLIPEKDHCRVQIVFGAEERAKVEIIRNELSVHTQAAYDQATTYHDGKWLFLAVDSVEVFADITKLLEVKRKSKKKA